MFAMLPLLLVAQAAAACPATPPAPPPPLAGWSRPVPLATGRAAADAGRLVPGRAVTATLRPMADVAFAVPPRRAAAVGRHGGVFAVRVPRPGRYRIALDRAAWIDIVSGGRTVASTAHGHGPACSGIRKMVDFDLTAGEHLVQVADSDAAGARLMVARLR